MQTMTWMRKWASSQLSKLGVVYLQVVDLIGVIFLSFFILPGALQRNTSCVFWTASLALPLQGFDTNALGLFCEHSVSRTLAPVQLSKLAGINLADDITGFRHSFIFISVLLLYGDGPNDKRGIAWAMSDFTSLSDRSCFLHGIELYCFTFDWTIK